MIYFIQGDGGGPIKIGCAGNPWQRLATLQTGNPTKLSVIAVIPGDRPDESMLHARFSASRGHGEWFMPSVDLISFIEGILAAQREAPIKPMAVDNDTLVGLSRDQIEAIGVALTTRALFKQAEDLLMEYADVSPLPDSVFLLASSLLHKFESIEVGAESISNDGLSCEPHIVLASAFFDGYGSYNRMEFIVYLREVMARHSMSFAESLLSDETVQPIRDIESDERSAASDFMVN